MYRNYFYFFLFLSVFPEVPLNEENILTGLTVDESPDVFLLNLILISTIITENILLGINPFIGGLGIDTSRWFSVITNHAATRIQFIFPN
jgi:hypothetical protein